MSLSNTLILSSASGCLEGLGGGGVTEVYVSLCVWCVLGGLFRLTGPEDDRWPAEQKKLQNFRPLRHVRRNSVPHETPGLSVVTPNYHQQQHPAAPTGRTAPSDGQRFVLSHAQREERKRNRDAHMMPMGCAHAWVLMRVLGCSLVQCEVCLKSGSFCCFSSLFSSQESLFWLTRILPSFLLFLLCFQRFSFLPFPPLKVTLCPIFARQDTFNCISKDSVGLSSRALQNVCGSPALQFFMFCTWTGTVGQGLGETLTKNISCVVFKKCIYLSKFLKTWPLFFILKASHTAVWHAYRTWHVLSGQCAS